MSGFSSPSTALLTGSSSALPSGGPLNPTGSFGGLPPSFGDPSALHDLQLNRGPLIIGITSTLLALTLVALGLRLTSRYIGRMKLLWDDWFAIVAAVLLCAKAGIIIRMVSPTVGISFQETQTFLELIDFIFILYPLIIGFAKCSILCFYIRLFGPHRPFRHFCYGILACIVAWSIAVFFPTLFLCGVPVSNAWNLGGPGLTCIDKENFFLASTVLDAAFDVIILVAPLRPIWKLNLSARKKLAITGAFLLGASEVAFTLARVVIFAQVKSIDTPSDFSNVIIWSTTQESIGVLCVCLPVLGPLFQRQRRRRGAGYSRTDFPPADNNISSSNSTGGRLGILDGIDKNRSTPARFVDGEWSYEMEQQGGIRKTVDVEVQRLVRPIEPGLRNMTHGV